MNRNFSIITVGLSPAWDILCYGEGLEWGLHKEIDTTTFRPAGKALNISQALAWMGQENIAAGLWGRDDYQQMLKAMRSLGGMVKVKMTAVDGGTRRNITVVDTANDREMHLRNRSELTSKKALRKLEADLRAIVHKGSVCVFAGMMPEDEFVEDLVRIIKSCRERNARIVVDTYGDALKRILKTGAAWLIKPNVEELRELLGEQVPDNPTALAGAGRKLLDKAEIVVISRGRKGGVVVTKKGAWQGRCIGRGRVLSTVGCGDYLLGGFLKGLKNKSDAGSALVSAKAEAVAGLGTAIKVATAKAWGWTDKMSWLDVQSKIKVQVGWM
ncbi:MAG TPA: PfkB family carbohydrate kinase [Sedimentisphaerales bacterium]|nr:PfkB family carbohydrate kinase [Sedimentisphaerales bacterium]